LTAIHSELPLRLQNKINSLLSVVENLVSHHVPAIYGHSRKSTGIPENRRRMQSWRSGDGDNPFVPLHGEARRITVNFAKLPKLLGKP
jgi:hypothetical protein